jgi:Protein kinase domain
MYGDQGLGFSMSTVLTPLRRSPPRTCLALGDVVTDPTIQRRYRVEELIGKGGMGEVFRGVCLETAEPCAIKSIPLALADDPKIAVRTQFEAMALRELRHPNVVQVFASGVREDGAIFMVMQLLHGETLQEVLRRRGPLSVRQAIRVVRDVCLGLEAVHVYAIHRDIKPANIHLGLDGVVRLLDLGACKWKQSGLQLTSTGIQLGTFVFMSPEQLDSSAPLDTRSDIWSLGVVLYELLTGVNPFAFEGTLPENKFLVGRRIIEQPHTPLAQRAPGAPAYLGQIIDKCLAKKPEQRYQSAADLGRVLTGALQRMDHDEGRTAQAPDPLQDLVAEMAGAARPAAPLVPLHALLRTEPLIVAPPPAASALADAREPVLRTALAWAQTDEVPAQPARAVSGEYERETMLPSYAPPPAPQPPAVALEGPVQAAEISAPGTRRDALFPQEVDTGAAPAPPLPFIPAPPMPIVFAPPAPRPSPPVAFTPPVPVPAWTSSVPRARAAEPIRAPRRLDRMARWSIGGAPLWMLLLLLGMLALSGLLWFGPDLATWLQPQSDLPSKHPGGAAHPTTQSIAW